MSIQIIIYEYVCVGVIFTFNVFRPKPSRVDNINEKNNLKLSFSEIDAK